MVAFPVFIVAAAEHVYQACIHAGWAKDDDSTIWRLYLRDYPDDTVHQMTKTGSTLVSRDNSITVQDIIDIFAGGHLGAAVEAMGFTEAVGLDTDVMYDIVSQAAGSNTQFIDHVPKMKKPTWSLRDVPEAKGIQKRLVSTSCPFTRANLTLATGGRSHQGELDRRTHASCGSGTSIVQMAPSIDYGGIVDLN